jgi:ankyrin repeat protein
MKSLNLTHQPARYTRPAGALRTGFTVLATGLSIIASLNCASTQKMSAQDETQFISAVLNGRTGVDAKDRRGETALMLAARQGNPETVGQLLKHDADPNAKDKGGRTVLMYAAVSGNMETISLLLEYGGDVNAKDKAGKTALDYAKENNRTETADILRANMTQ